MRWPRRSWCTDSTFSTAIATAATTTTTNDNRL
jgi:hypothetical protein